MEECVRHPSARIQRQLGTAHPANQLAGRRRAFAEAQAVLEEADVTAALVEIAPTVAARAAAALAKAT